MNMRVIATITEAHVHRYAASAEDFRDELAVDRALTVDYALPLAAGRMPLKVSKTYPFETGAPAHSG